MKKLLELGNEYARRSTWKDFAAVKFCLCSIGLMIGMSVPDAGKKLAFGIAVLVFLLTYIPLMAKVFRIAKDMIKKGS